MGAVRQIVLHFIIRIPDQEFIVSLLAIKKQAFPPTISLDQPDPECDLDYAPNISRKGVKVHTVMSNAFGFGGTNAVLIAGKMKEAGS